MVITRTVCKTVADLAVFLAEIPPETPICTEGLPHCEAVLQVNETSREPRKFCLDLNSYDEEDALYEQKETYADPVQELRR